MSGRVAEGNLCDERGIITRVYSLKLITLNA